jgi:hypothetical protein
MPKTLLVDSIGLPITMWVISSKVGMPQQKMFANEVGNDIAYEMSSLVCDNM